MTKARGGTRLGHPDTVWEQLFEHYINHDCNLGQLSKDSLAVCGVHVNDQSVRNYAIQNRWGTLKARHLMGRTGMAQGVIDEADDLRQIVYDTIMDPDGKKDIKDLTALIGAWEKLKGLGSRVRSHKTARQQQIEATRRGIEKAMAEENDE